MHPSGDVRTFPPVEAADHPNAGRGPIAAELLEAARQAIGAAQELGTRMRLLGGIAVHHLAESSRREPLARTYHDYDVVVPPREGSVAAKVFRALGYREDPHFNALHGAQRLIFSSTSGFDVDVLVGTFQMCHRLELGSDLPESGLTIHPADLLLTKLQIVEIEEKDLRDSVALLADVAVGEDPEAISPRRFTHPLAADWGFFHTVERNLERVDTYAERTIGARGAGAVRLAVEALRAEMERAPKSAKWKLRARVGERVAWYELPEEV